MKAVRLGAAITAGFVTSVLLGSATQADNYDGATGSAGEGCDATRNIKADNDDHRFNYQDLNDGNREASDRARHQDLNPTDIETSMSDQESADVIVRDDNYITYCGFGWDGPRANYLGLAECLYINHHNECARFGVKYDTSDTNDWGDNGRQELACEEFGHTVGLVHRQGGCMEGGQSGGIHLTPHDVEQIDIHYPPGGGSCLIEAPEC